MKKEILENYVGLKAEVADLRNRIDRDERRLEKIDREGVVSDTVKGTRADGTIGSIKITGYPIPEYNKVKTMMRNRIRKLKIMEEELQETLNAVDDYIGTIPSSDLRMIFRLRYIDDKTWAAVAINMNYSFPKRRTKYTEDNCRKRHDRYLLQNEAKQPDIEDVTK